ncbi:hypothetical protein VTH06DRAFT_4002 [Thermothelomyces fergusii]
MEPHPIFPSKHLSGPRGSSAVGRVDRPAGSSASYWWNNRAQTIGSAPETGLASHATRSHNRIEHSGQPPISTMKNGAARIT